MADIPLDKSPETSNYFMEYDSNDFPTIPESIHHSVDNALLIENLSDKLQTSFGTRNVLVQEPSCAFKDTFMMYLEDKVRYTLVPPEEFYRPEMTAKRLYGSADLWYILLYLNTMFSTADYNKRQIKYVGKETLEKMITYINLSVGRIRQVEDYDISNTLLR